MPRSPNELLQDILESIKRIERYVGGVSFEKFSSDSLIFDAVMRNLIIIGEAVKNIPESVKKDFPSIEWKKIAGLKGIVTHKYYGINENIIWNLVKTKIPELKEEIEKIASNLFGKKC